MSVRSLNLSLADSLDIHSPLLCSSFLAARGQTSCPTSSMGETSMCYAHFKRTTSAQMKPGLALLRELLLKETKGYSAPL